MRRTRRGGRPRGTSTTRGRAPERATKSKEERRRLQIKRLETAERLKKQEAQIQKDLEAMRNPVLEPVPSIPKPIARFSNIKPGHLQRVAQHRYNSARSAHRSLRRSNRSNKSASATFKHHSRVAPQPVAPVETVETVEPVEAEPEPVEEVEPEPVQAEKESVSSQLSHVGILKKIHNHLKTTACAYLPGKKRDWCETHEEKMESRRKRELAHKEKLEKQRERELAKKKQEKAHSSKKSSIHSPENPFESPYSSLSSSLSQSHQYNPLIDMAPPMKEDKVHTHNPFQKLAKNQLIGLKTRTASA